MQGSEARKAMAAKKAAKKMIKKTLTCISCQKPEFHYYVVDEGQHAAIYRFCEECIKFKERRTETFVSAYIRLSPECPESGSHRDVDVWLLPAWEDLRDVEAELSVKFEAELFQHAYNHESSAGDFISQINQMAARDELGNALPDEDIVGELEPQKVPTLKHLANVALGEGIIALNPNITFSNLRETMHNHLRQPLIDSLVDASEKRLHDLKTAHFTLLEKLQVELKETKEEFEKAIKEYEEKDEDASEDPEEMERIHSMENIIERNTHHIADLEKINVEEEFGGLSNGFISHLSEIAWSEHCKTVDLKKSNMRVPDTKLLSFMCETLKIDNLNLSWNFMNSTAISPILKVLKCNTMVSLDLSWCKIGNSFTHELGDILPHVTALTKISIRGNKLTPIGFKAFSTGLKENRSITYLDAGFNFCKLDGANFLGEALFRNNVIKRIELRSCSIGANGALVLARKLRFCDNLTDLILSDNKVGRQGARDIAKNLQLTSGALIRCFGWRYGRELDVYDQEETELTLDMVE